jgi:shikimate kinase
MRRTLFLVGFMASGKSSLGRKIAKTFDMDFVDLDEAIELAEGKSINELFEQKGEETFREIEAKELRALDLENKVIATGGGTPIYHENMDFMKENGAVAYLVVPTEIILGRLRQNAESRPLIKDLDDEALKEYVETTLEQRKTVYSQADILIPHTKSFSLLKMELSFLLS